MTSRKPLTFVVTIVSGPTEYRCSGTYDTKEAAEAQFPIILRDGEDVDGHYDGRGKFVPHPLSDVSRWFDPKGITSLKVRRA